PRAEAISGVASGGHAAASRRSEPGERAAVSGAEGAGGTTGYADKRGIHATRLGADPSCVSQSWMGRAALVLQGRRRGSHYAAQGWHGSCGQGVLGPPGG